MHLRAISCLHACAPCGPRRKLISAMPIKPGQLKSGVLEPGVEIPATDVPLTARWTRRVMENRQKNRWSKPMHLQMVMLGGRVKAAPAIPPVNILIGQRMLGSICSRQSDLPGDLYSLQITAALRKKEITKPRRQGRGKKRRGRRSPRRPNKNPHPLWVDLMRKSGCRHLGLWRLSPAALLLFHKWEMNSSTSNRAIRLTSGLFAELRLTASTLRSSRGTDSTSGIRNL